jgi:ABC-type transporter Mla subunit MlaD
MGVIMKKVVIILLACLGLFALVVVSLPRLTSKETLTYAVMHKTQVTQ